MNRAEKRASAKAIKKAKPLKLAEEPNPAIPKDLSDKWGVVQQIATIHSLLQKGNFTLNWHSQIVTSVNFLGKFHEEMVTDLLKHPDAHLIPELKLAQEKEKAAANEKN